MQAPFASISMLYIYIYIYTLHTVISPNTYFSPISIFGLYWNMRLILHSLRIKSLHWLQMFQ
jgi:hypothetical protein